MTVQGHCDPRYDSVRQLFERHISSGNELGASICVNIAGTNVVDIWGGYTDEAQSKPWEKDTIVPVWSSSNCITNLAALLLVDRGLLDPYARVSQNWPEFAANGKKNVKPYPDIYDVPLSTERLAAQAPWWTPGTESGYHVVSQGHLVGELVRRITGKSLGQFIRDELATPLGADFRLGAEEKDYPRIADLTKPEAPSVPAFPPDPNSIALRAMKGTRVFAEDVTKPSFRNSELGGANGISHARALNRILSVITLNGEVDGRRYLSPKTIDLIFREQSNGPDLVLGTHVLFGIGFALPARQTADWIPDGRVCFWSGWGGVRL